MGALGAAAQTAKLPRNAIDASPTKEFFIDMLTRDIEIIPAIIDLVDNCIDGALRIRPGREFAGLSVRIRVGPPRFEIADNCGGIDIRTAKEYAFRFGRPAEVVPTKGSIGQFGVGMKRALFKLGTNFRIVSSTEKTTFVMDVNVNKWKKDQKWQFAFESRASGLRIPSARRGTKIVVKPLHDGVGQDFQQSSFPRRLAIRLKETHQQAMQNGLAISVNGIPVHSEPTTVQVTDSIGALYDELEIPGGKNQPVVKVEIFAGIEDPRRGEPGWNVYCNGRLVLASDKTYLTGWGEGGGKTVPKYHPQFARFRGFVFFESDDADRLPWTTTKINVDADSQAFRAVRPRLVKAMRPVITFLNRLDAENDRRGRATPYYDAIEGARSMTLMDAPRTKSFFQAPKRRTTPVKNQRITYSRPKEKVAKLMEALGAETAKETGGLSFDRVYEEECE